MHFCILFCFSVAPQGQSCCENGPKGPMVVLSMTREALAFCGCPWALLARTRESRSEPLPWVSWPYNIHRHTQAHVHTCMHAQMLYTYSFLPSSMKLDQTAGPCLPRWFSVSPSHLKHVFLMMNKCRSLPSYSGASWERCLLSLCTADSCLFSCRR